MNEEMPSTPYEPRKVDFVLTDPPKKENTWLVPVLVTALVFIVLGVMGLVGWLLVSSDNDVINAVDPQPNLSESEDSTSDYDAAYSLIEMSFDSEIPESDVQEICSLWGAGMDDMFVEEFLKGLHEGGDTIPMSDFVVEEALRDFMADTCGI